MAGSGDEVFKWSGAFGVMEQSRTTAQNNELALGSGNCDIHSVRKLKEAHSPFFRIVARRKENYKWDFLALERVYCVQFDESAIIRDVLFEHSPEVVKLVSVEGNNSNFLTSTHGPADDFANDLYSPFGFDRITSRADCTRVR